MMRGQRHQDEMNVSSTLMGEHRIEDKMNVPSTLRYDQDLQRFVSVLILKTIIIEVGVGIGSLIVTILVVDVFHQSYQTEETNIKIGRCLAPFITEEVGVDITFRDNNDMLQF